MCCFPRSCFVVRRHLGADNSFPWPSQMSLTEGPVAERPGLERVPALDDHRRPRRRSRRGLKASRMAAASPMGMCWISAGPRSRVNSTTAQSRRGPIQAMDGVTEPLRITVADVSFEPRAPRSLRENARWPYALPFHLQPRRRIRRCPCGEIGPCATNVRPKRRWPTGASPQQTRVRVPTGFDCSYMPIESIAGRVAPSLEGNVRW